MASSPTHLSSADSDQSAHYVIYGAGGIGATIGARLHRQNFKVTLIARGEHGRVLQQRGLHFIAPDCDEILQIPTVLHPREIVFDDFKCWINCGFAFVSFWNRCLYVV